MNLEHLTEGDEVVVFTDRSYRVARVGKVTATQIEIVCGAGKKTRYVRKSGKIIESLSDPFFRMTSFPVILDDDARARMAKRDDATARRSRAQCLASLRLTKIDWSRSAIISASARASAEAIEAAMDHLDAAHEAMKRAAEILVIKP